LPFAATRFISSINPVHPHATTPAERGRLDQRGLGPTSIQPIGSGDLLWEWHKPRAIVYCRTSRHCTKSHLMPPLGLQNLTELENLCSLADVSENFFDYVTSPVVRRKLKRTVCSSGSTELVWPQLTGL
jgi:hypothetical protein